VLVSRVCRKEHSSWHGKITLAVLIMLIRKHGVVIPQSISDEIYRAYGVKGAYGEMCLKVRVFVSMMEESHFLFLFQEITKLEDSDDTRRGGGKASGGKRLDLRSKNRLEASLQSPFPTSGSVDKRRDSFTK
jgi:hypothetical protein